MQMATISRQLTRLSGGTCNHTLKWREHQWGLLVSTPAGRTGLKVTQVIGNQVPGGNLVHTNHVHQQTQPRPLPNQIWHPKRLGSSDIPAPRLANANKCWKMWTRTSAWRLTTLEGLCQDNNNDTVLKQKTNQGNNNNNKSVLKPSD